MTVRRLALASFLLTLAACRSPDRGAAYVKSFADAERAETAGRYADAALAYDAAARAGKVPRDRDHARYLAARLLARAGRIDDAAARLRAIADARPPQEDSAEAAYTLADLALARGDQAGWAALDDVVRRFPSSGVARRALQRAVKHLDDARGPREGLAYLQSLVPAADASELAETVQYMIAQHIEATGDDAKARMAYLAVATRFPYPQGDFWDDALFRASVLDEKLGHVDLAIADLERMLAEREQASLAGSYERPRYEPAFLRICALYRDRLNDHARARACFDRFMHELETSELRDDALWEEARIAREDGDPAGACAVLASLASEFPDSRYVPCAVIQCPTVARPAKSAAPSKCHPYIGRERLGALPPGESAPGRDSAEARETGEPSEPSEPSEPKK